MRRLWIRWTPNLSWRRRCSLWRGDVWFPLLARLLRSKCSCINIMFQRYLSTPSEELVKALRGQPRLMQTALTQALVGHARVVMSLGQDCDILTQSCPHHSMIERPWRPESGLPCHSSFSPTGGTWLSIGQKTSREKLGIDVIEKVKDSVIKVHGSQVDIGMELLLVLRASPKLML